MKGCKHEQMKARRGKSREVSSRFLSSPSASASSSPNRRNSTSNSITKNNKGLKKTDRMSDGNRVCLGFPNQSSLKVDAKENRRPPLRIDDEDNVMLSSVDECALYRTSSIRNSCSLLYGSLNDESDSELSDESFSSSHSIKRSSWNHKPGIKISSKYLHDLSVRPSKGNNSVTTRRSEEYSQRADSFRGIENRMKRAKPVARYGSSMSQWALSPGRSLETQAETIPTSKLKPPRVNGVGKMFNLGFDFFKSKNKSSSCSSPLKPKTCDTESAHQLKLMNNRLIQWRFVNARACAANKNIASREKNQLLCAWDTLTKLKLLVLQKKINLQKKNLEMKLHYVLLSQIKHLEAWEDMERQHFSSLSMTKETLHSALSRLPSEEGAKVDIESAATSFQNAEAVTDAIMSTVYSYAPTMEAIVSFAFQLAEVAAQEKLVLEQCNDLLRMMSELEIQERSLKCRFLIQHKLTLDRKLLQH